VLETETLKMHVDLLKFNFSNNSETAFTCFDLAQFHVISSQYNIIDQTYENKEIRYKILAAENLFMHRESDQIEDDPTEDDPVDA